MRIWIRYQNNSEMRIIVFFHLHMVIHAQRSGPWPVPFRRRSACPPGPAASHPVRTDRFSLSRPQKTENTKTAIAIDRALCMWYFPALNTFRDSQVKLLALESKSRSGSGLIWETWQLDKLKIFLLVSFDGLQRRITATCCSTLRITLLVLDIVNTWTLLAFGQWQKLLWLK